MIREWSVEPHKDGGVLIHLDLGEYPADIIVNGATATLIEPDVIPLTDLIGRPLPVAMLIQVGRVWSPEQFLCLIR